MKTRFAIALAVAGIMFYGAAARTASAATFSDDFSSGLRPAYWTVIQTTPGLFSVDDTHGDVRLAKVGNNPGGFQDVAVTLDLAAVGGPISGDFSMQIDFSNAVVGPNNDQVPLNMSLSDSSPFADTYDSLSCGSLNVHVWNGGVQGCTSVKGNSGTFTISRTGGTLTGSYNGSPIFSESNSSVVSYISFSLQLQPGSNDNTSVTFDNFSLTAASVPSACTTPPPQMVSWWPGDGNANDIQGSHNGTLENGATFAPGLVAQAFSFNGSNQFVQVANDPVWNFGAGDFTIDLWINFNSLDTEEAFLGHDEGAGAQNKWVFERKNGQLNFHINSPSIGNPGIDITSTPAFTPNTGEWHHAAVTKSGTSYTFYVDGNPGTPVTESTPIPTANAPLVIGTNGENSFFTNGLIDEVEIFNRALSASEIQAIVAAGAFGKCKGTPTPTPTPTATSTPTATPTPTPTSTPCAGRCTPTPRPRPTPAPRPTS